MRERSRSLGYDVPLCVAVKSRKQSFFLVTVIEAQNAAYFFVEMGRVRLDAVALASNGIITVAVLYGLKHVMLISVIRVVYGVCLLLERVVNLLVVVQVVRTKSVKSPHIVGAHAFV